MVCFVSSLNSYIISLLTLFYRNSTPNMLRHIAEIVYYNLLDVVAIKWSGIVIYRNCVYDHFQTLKFCLVSLHFSTTLCYYQIETSFQRVKGRGTFNSMQTQSNLLYAYEILRKYNLPWFRVLHVSCNKSAEEIDVVCDSATDHIFAWINKLKFKATDNL